MVVDDELAKAALGKFRQSAAPLRMLGQCIASIDQFVDETGGCSRVIPRDEPLDLEQAPPA